MWFKIASFLCLLLLGLPNYADTMDHYMGIVNNIPKMEIKADGQAQIWAKSARNVVLLTCESVAESLTIANIAASRKNAPLFCLPPNVVLTGETLQNLLQQTYSEISSQEGDKSKMTVSEVALLAVSKTYPCTQTQTQANLPLIRIQSVRGAFR